MRIKDTKREMGITHRPTKTDNAVQVRVRLEPDIAKALIRLADQQAISVGHCAANLIALGVKDNG